MTSCLCPPSFINTLADRLQKVTSYKSHFKNNLTCTFLSCCSYNNKSEALIGLCSEAAWDSESLKMSESRSTFHPSQFTHYWPLQPPNAIFEIQFAAILDLFSYSSRIVFPDYHMSIVMAVNLLRWQSIAAAHKASNLCFGLFKVWAIKL